MTSRASLVWASKKCTMRGWSSVSAWKRRLAVLLLLIPMQSVRSLGQEDRPDLSNLSLEQLGQIKVYSASKHTQAAGDAPSSVTVITAEEIQQHGYRTLADILRNVRGFYVSYDRDYDYVGVRGFGRPGDYNTRVLLLIDGHRTNDNVYDQAMLGAEFPLDVDLIERVEIVRGPSSSLYGSNAFFAVINVITRSKSDLKGWEFSFEPASFGTYSGRVSYGGSFKGADVVASSTFSDSAGQNFFFPEFNSPETNGGIVRNADYERYHDLLLTVNFHEFTFQAVDGLRKKGIPTAPYGTIFGDTRTDSTDEHQYLDLGYRNSLGAWELRVRTYYDRYAYDGHWAYEQGRMNIDYVRGQRWGEELQLSREIAQKHHLTFGAELRNNFQQDQKNYDLVPPFLYFNDRRSSWMGAGFVQDEYAITRQLTLNAGVRYDHYTRYGGSGNPRVALIYHPFQSSSFKLLYGTAFRVPTAFESYYGTNDAGGTLFIFNPHLAPESMQNIEGVWEQSVDKHVQISTAVFRAYIHDLITLQSGLPDGALMFLNSDEARSTGIEFELKGQLPRGLKGTLSYSYTETEDQRTGRILVNSPSQLAQLSLTAPVYKQAIVAAADAQYVGARRTLSENFAPAFPLVNLTLLGHAWNKHLDISASIYNLFDRRHFDVAPEEDLQHTLQQDGRNFRVKLTWHWGGKR